MFSFRSGGTESGFGPRHTRVVENGKSCTPLGAKILGEGLRLVAPVSLYLRIKSLFFYLHDVMKTVGGVKIQ